MPAPACVSPQRDDSRDHEAPLTAIAGFAILFTGRYPPFSLYPDPSFPADLAVDYPQRLSRGLVLVKWCLLAIPHFLVVALFAGGRSGWVGEDWQFASGGGLIGILVVVAAGTPRRSAAGCPPDWRGPWLSSSAVRAWRTTYQRRPSPAC